LLQKESAESSEPKTHSETDFEESQTDFSISFDLFEDFGGDPDFFSESAWVNKRYYEHRVLSKGF